MSVLLAKGCSNFQANRAIQHILQRTKCDAIASRKRKMKRLQEKFQSDDHCPVFLKGGALDRTLYLTTIGMTIAGIAYSGIWFLRLD